MNVPAQHSSTHLANSSLCSLRFVDRRYEWTLIPRSHLATATCDCDKKWNVYISQLCHNRMLRCTEWEQHPYPKMFITKPLTQNTPFLKD